MKKTLVVLIFTSILLLSSCSEDIINDELDQRPEGESMNNQSEEDDGNNEIENSNNSYNFELRQYNITTSEIVNPQLELLESKNSIISRKHYSPNKELYIEEKIDYDIDPEYGVLNGRKYLFADKEILFDGDYMQVLKEKSLSPSPVWIDDNTVVVSGFFGGGREVNINSDNDIITNNIRSYHGCDINEKHDRLVMNGSRAQAGTYDIQKKEFEKLYSLDYDYPIYGMHLNSVWGLDNTVYLDDLKVTKKDGKDLIDYSIKEYNMNTDTLSDFCENGYIISRSPDYRYLVYVDESTMKTVIMDNVDTKKFEIPYSIEFIWTPDSKDFYYSPVEVPNKLIREKFTKDGREVIEYDLTEYVKENQEIINLWLNKDGDIIFDIVQYEEIFINAPTLKEGFYDTNIDNVTTYQIKSK